MHLLILMAGCSEYGINAEKDEPTPTEPDTDTPIVDTDPPLPVDDDPCGKLELEPSSVSVDEDCKIEGVFGTFKPVLKWENQSLGDAYTTPVVGQLTDDNGDGVVDALDTPDIVVAAADGKIHVVAGDDGALHWSAGSLGSEPSTPAIGDIDGDGDSEIVAVGYSNPKNPQGHMTAFDGRTGAQLWQVDSPLVAGASGASWYLYESCGGVGLYDLDGDGDVEALFGAWIVDAQTGATIGVGEHGKGTGHFRSDGLIAAAMSVAADIDLDGSLEVVVGNAVYDASGNTIWYNEESDGYVAVANFDEDDEAEIVVTTYPGRIRLQDGDGDVIWDGAYTGDTVGPPTVADFDGDGKPEIGVAGHGVYAVIEHDGTLKWTRETQDFSSGFTGSSVFDFEGDGAAEVVYADEVSVWIFDGRTGDVRMEETRHSSITCSEYPAIADVDGDGHAEIVYTSSLLHGGGHAQGVRVIEDENDSWVAAPTFWNQHGYSITNVGDDGSIPAYPEPNWLTYNNFRSGGLGESLGSVMADPVPVLDEVCLLACDEGTIKVSVLVGNGGVYDLASGMPVSGYAETTTGEWTWVETRTWNGSVPPGQTSDGMLFEVDPTLLETGRMMFVVNDEGGGGKPLNECHPENNELIVDGLLCE